MFSSRAIQFVVGIAFLCVIALFSVWPSEWWPDKGERAPSQPPQAHSENVPPPRKSARGPTAGANADFDYYVLVLSWSPTHCASERGRGADDEVQCRSGRAYGFVLHGLWPQYERGYPKDCTSNEPREVEGDVLDRVMKISPSEELVQHEWVKHGTCSGLSQRDYFAAAERAFASISTPDAYNRPGRAITTTPNEVRDAFLAANQALASNALAATCSRNDLAELWICLDKTLAPRKCSADVAKRHCGRREVRMRAVRGDWPR